MLSFFKFKLRTIIKRNIYYIIIINIVLCEEITFFDIKKLSIENSYFVVLDNGLYLYNKHFNRCALIH